MKAPATSDKLSIWNEMKQLDQKNRGFYDELTESEQKKFSPFVLLRWASCVGGNNLELQKYYLISTNEQANKNFFSATKHKKLQWLLLTTISPGMGTHKHEWIPFAGKQPRNKRAQLLVQLFPDMKTSDAERLSGLIPDAEIKARLEQLGWEDKKIKEALK